MPIFEGTEYNSALSSVDKSTPSGLRCYINELKIFDSETAKFSEKIQKQTLKTIEKDIQKADDLLDKIIKEDENLSRIFKITTSITGVGKITTLFLFCFTNEFSMYTTARQLACYAGVVPFEHCSGKSVRSKPKVHHMANKKLKTLLSMCATSSITADPELKEYYNRKLEEGKNKKLVINYIKNKLVHRICACIRDNRVFEKRQIA